MTTEYIVVDPIVACLTIKAPAPQATSPGAEPWFRILCKILKKVCLPPADDVIFFEGRAYCPVYANNRDPKKSCSWTETEDGGGKGHVVLAYDPKMWVRVEVALRVAKDARCAWLTVTHNPTTLTVGHNVHPAGFLDPRTGVADLWPSSSWAAMTRAFRLGFAFLEALSAPAALFDAATRAVIARGDFHLVRAQYATTKVATNVTDFLQGGTVIYGQTIARGRGIINNAKHLGLRFKPYVDEDSPENRVSGFMLQKLHGEKFIRGYHSLLALNDRVAAAWRSDPTPGASNWAGRFARVAGCTRSTVYNRRDAWRKKYGIDIAYSLQMYSDILYYGHTAWHSPRALPR
jgi:hypothetical protein